MANVGSGAAGKTLIGNGNGQGPTYASIGTNSGLTQNGVVISKNLGAFEATSAGLSGQVLTSNGPSFKPTFQSSISSVSLATVTLTSSQIKALDTTPIVLVAAQGHGTSIMPVQIQSKYVYGGNNAFTNPQNINALYNDASGQIIASIAGSGFLDQTVSVYNLTSPNSDVIEAATVVEDTPIILFNNFSAITGNVSNDNSVVVTIMYALLTQ